MNLNFLVEPKDKLVGWGLRLALFELTSRDESQDQNGEVFLSLVNTFSFREISEKSNSKLGHVGRAESSIAIVEDLLLRLSKVL